MPSHYNNPYLDTMSGIADSFAEGGRITPNSDRPLGEVNDPEQLFADIAEDRASFVEDVVRPYQDQLIEQLGSTDLIDQAAEDATSRSRLQQEIDQRNLSRYGIREAGAARRARRTSAQLTGSLAQTDALNNARLQQRTANQNLLGQLVGLSLGVDQSTLSQLGQAASLQGARESAYTRAKAQQTAQRYSFISQLFSMI
tara:strand:- start:11866 stop:12462 length:597 start_codon:yes stop_codon:yes gene_type:complete